MTQRQARLLYTNRIQLNSTLRRGSFLSPPPRLAGRTEMERGKTGARAQEMANCKGGSVSVLTGRGGNTSCSRHLRRRASGPRCPPKRSSPVPPPRRSPGSKQGAHGLQRREAELGLCWHNTRRGLAWQTGTRTRLEWTKGPSACHRFGRSLLQLSQFRGVLFETGRPEPYVVLWLWLCPRFVL